MDPVMLLSMSQFSLKGASAPSAWGHPGSPGWSWTQRATVTEVLSVDASTATPTTPPRSGVRATTSSGASSGTSVEETGTVKWFNVDKGFGFIARDGGGEDLFVHISALEPSGLTAVNEGERVIFTVAEGRKGLEAVQVRLV